VLAAGSGTALGDALTDQAKGLLEQGRAKEAYQLLLPRESERAGEVEFDYLLGIAANDAGEHERAVFALERVLALQPRHHLARAEIARAYLALGEREAARRELETVRSQSIPEEAKASIERLLAAIRAAETTRIEGYLELGFGYDSNVNAATSSTQVALPGLGGIIATLDSSATRRGDAVTALAGGLNVTHKLAQRWALLGTAAAAARLHPDESRFDQLTLDGSIGGRWSRERDSITVGGQFQSFEVDDARFRETRGLVAQWQHAYDDNRQVSLFGQHARLRYPTQRIRDADRTVLGTAYAKAFSVRFSPVVFTSAYAGSERERGAGVPHLGHELWGVRLGAELRLGRGWGVQVGASHEERRYGGTEPLFAEARKDRQTDLSAGITYLLRARTTLLAQLAYTDNRSNIPIHAFDRSVGTLSVRFAF
jgi:tetratricopeptide (TPR) repeat protein